MVLKCFRVEAMCLFTVNHSDNRHVVDRLVRKMTKLTYEQMTH